MLITSKPCPRKISSCATSSSRVGGPVVTQRALTTFLARWFLSWFFVMKFLLISRHELVCADAGVHWSGWQLCPIPDRRDDLRNPWRRWAQEIGPGGIFFPPLFSQVPSAPISIVIFFVDLQHLTLESFTYVRKLIWNKTGSNKTYKGRMQDGPPVREATRKYQGVQMFCFSSPFLCSSSCSCILFHV